MRSQASQGSVAQRSTLNCQSGHCCPTCGCISGRPRGCRCWCGLSSTPGCFKFKSFYPHPFPHHRSYTVFLHSTTCITWAREYCPGCKAWISPVIVKCLETDLLSPPSHEAAEFLAFVARHECLVLEELTVEIPVREYISLSPVRTARPTGAKSWVIGKSKPSLCTGENKDMISYLLTYHCCDICKWFICNKFDVV